MAIPDIDTFNEFLSSLTLDLPKDSSSYGRLEVIPGRLLSDSEEMGATEPVWLWYRRSSVLTPDNVVLRLCKELRAQDHSGAPEIAHILLALLCLMPQIDNSPVGCLNKILSFIGMTDCSRFLISPFPPHPDSVPFKLGNFTVGALNRQRLVYRCKKADCDFFERYPNQFMHREAIESIPVTVRVLDFGSLRKISNFLEHPFGPDLCDYYFETLSSLQRDAFLQEFLESQEVLVAAGAPSMHIDFLQAWRGCFFICIFQGIQPSGKGYFCPLGHFPIIDFAQADRRIPEKVAELEKAFNFTGLSTNEIHSTLRTYCRFVTKARNHKINNRREEAFLHYVIALDLLLGGKESSTQNVARRTAIMVSNVLGKQFQDIYETVKELYNRRSRYVHEGISVSEKDIEVIEPIIDQVLWCLLRLQAMPVSRHSGFIEGWLKTLDYLAAAVEAGKTPDDQEFVATGIEPKSSV